MKRRGAGRRCAPASRLLSSASTFAFGLSLPRVPERHRHPRFTAATLRRDAARGLIHPEDGVLDHDLTRALDHHLGPADVAAPRRVFRRRQAGGALELGFRGHCTIILSLSELSRTLLALGAWPPLIYLEPASPVFSSRGSAQPGQ